LEIPVYATDYDIDIVTLNETKAHFIASPVELDVLFVEIIALMLTKDYFMIYTINFYPMLR